MKQDNWRISLQQSWVDKPKVVSHNNPAMFLIRVTATYVYCWGNVRPAAPGHGALKIKINRIDTKQAMLQDLLPIAIFH